MRYLLLVFVAGCSTAPAFTVEDRAGLGAFLAYEVVTQDASPAPGPAPTPKPAGDVCPECDGVGKVGDGTIMLTCPECGGTGKATGSEPSIEDVSSGPDWNFEGNWNPTLSEMRRHLQEDHDVDASRMTAAECRALHSLLHNSETRTAPVADSCPTGNCPTSGSRTTTTRRRGLFGRLR